MLANARCKAIEVILLVCDKIDHFFLDPVTLSVLRDIRATGLIMLIYTCSMRRRETRVLGARTHGIKAV